LSTTTQCHVELQAARPHLRARFEDLRDLLLAHAP
jgi:hypothetical protein